MKMAAAVFLVIAALVCVFVDASNVNEGGVFSPKELPCQYRIDIQTKGLGQTINSMVEANNDYTRIYQDNQPPFTILFRPDVQMSGQWLQVQWYKSGSTSMCSCGSGNYDTAQEHINTLIPFLHANLSYSSSEKTKFHGQECTVYHCSGIEDIDFFGDEEGYLIGQSNPKSGAEVYYKMTKKAPMSDFQFDEDEFPNCYACKEVYNKPKDEGCADSGNSVTMAAAVLTFFTICLLI